MNWLAQTLILQAVLTIIPCLIILLIFRFLNKKRVENGEMEE